MHRSAVLLSLAILALPAGALAQTPVLQSPSPESGSSAPVDIAAISTPPAGTPDHDRLAPKAEAVVVTGEIHVDGRLDEPVWSTAPAVTRFLQQDPDLGRPATQRTEVRFAYDKHNLYVGARMFDDEGAAGVVGRLVRRDASAPSDWLILTLDTFLDHRGQTILAVNPSGSRWDSYGPGGSNPDDSWDPVWEVKTTVDSLGWTAEMAIPFSQLRFRPGEKLWGLQIERQVNRLNETDVWSFWDRDVQGGPSRFGHLAIATPTSGVNRLELLPYTVAQVQTHGSVDAENPFDRSHSSTYRVGTDLKYLVTPNLTLSATINPDFGQAEVDPAVVNLSEFETFFPEKREFFIEGSGLFDFGNFWCYTCSNTSSLNMLFTRRIGRPPQAASLADDAGDYADVPGSTTILGAAKLTGRTSGGTSLGVLAALTGKETAGVATADGSRFDQEVMPLTSYGVARVKQDFADGDLQVGGILTSVARRFDDPALRDLLPSHSEGFGLDAEYWWADQTYHFLASGAMTNVSGSAAAIQDLQESSVHYLQRPDRGAGSNGFFTRYYEPGLTSLRGYALYARIAKDGGLWRWEAETNVRSPGFENNDYSFLTRTDYVYVLGNLRRRWTTPTSLYRFFQFNLGAQQETNFDGVLTSRQYHASLYTITPFYWEASLFGLYRPSTLDDRLTRGGPMVRDPSQGYMSLYLQTDSRRPVFASINPTTGWNSEGVRDWGIGGEVTFRPASNVSVSLGPRYDLSGSTSQYVDTVDDPTAQAFYGSRYVFSDLRQKTLSMDTRVNWTFTPTMSLELFAQPYISANDFSRFKEFVAPRSEAKAVYGEDVGTIRAEGAGDDLQYVIDPDGSGPAQSFSIDDPNFVFRSLRGNLVFRWEYVPGSTLFLVWTQDRSSQDALGNLDFGRDVGHVFGGDANNVFLVKLTYWLGI